MRRLVRVLATGVAVRAWAVAPVRAADSIVVRADAVEPPVLRTTTGERVTFVNRSQRPVHVEFAGNARAHHVVQLPARGEIWAVFHRAGPHPYVVHVGDVRERTLRGVVEAIDVSPPPVEPPECAVSVMDVCVEP
jgi:hypothetical protein